ncbi:hypothetical protein MASR1M107_31260 [Ignavibacteriales bacterium]
MLNINSNIPPSQFSKQIESLLLKAIDDSSVELNCPTCESNLKVKLKDIKKSKRVVCHSCNQGIQLQYKEK